MTTTAPTTNTPVTLRLTERARARLAEQAANSGQDLSAIASDLIERAVTRPSIAQIMAPVHQQVAESGMSATAVDDLLHSEWQAHRQEKKAKSA